jgi:hypothetical protein
VEAAQLEQREVEVAVVERALWPEEVEVFQEVQQRHLEAEQEDLKATAEVAS